MTTKPTTTPSAAPGGTISDEQLQPTAAAPGSINTRLDRLKLWHAGAKSSAGRLKLFVFLAGAEITALKSSLGVTHGGDQRAKGNGFTLLGDTHSTWQDLVAHQVGMTCRTARNYEIAYDTIYTELPDLGKRILDAVDISLKNEQAPLSLQLKFDEQLQKIRPADLQKFCEATDPWSLTELYRRELKPAQAAEAIQQAKKQAEQKSETRQMEFWLGEVAKEIKRKDYLRLPREHRTMLLEELELAVRELKASLTSPRQ